MFDAKNCLFMPQETLFTAFLSRMSRESHHTRFEDQILGKVSFWGRPASCASLFIYKQHDFSLLCQWPLVVLLSQHSRLIYIGNLASLLREIYMTHSISTSDFELHLRRNLFCVHFGRLYLWFIAIFYHFVCSRIHFQKKDKVTAWERWGGGQRKFKQSSNQSPALLSSVIWRLYSVLLSHIDQHWPFCDPDAEDIQCADPDPAVLHLHLILMGRTTGVLILLPILSTWSWSQWVGRPVLCWSSSLPSPPSPPSSPRSAWPTSRNLVGANS